MKPQYSLFIGTDHGGFELKEQLKPWLSQENDFSIETIADVGASLHEGSDSFAPFGAAVGRRISEMHEAVEENPHAVGILLCRSGAGMAITANRFPYVRAVVCRNVAQAIHAREHDNANVVVLESDNTNFATARAIVHAFLTTAFEGGRHVVRLQQIEELTRV